MARTNINILRAGVYSREKAARKKISRNRTVKGIELRGTKYDPLKAKPIAAMTSRELKAYHRQLDQFVNRKTQFEKLGSGEPVTRQDWKKYQAAERAYIAKQTQRMKPIEDLELPGGLRVKDRLAIVNPANGLRRDTAAPTARVLKERTPEQIASAASLERLTRDFKRRITKRYERETMRAMKNAAFKMLKDIGDVELMQQISNLSDKQFELLWTATSFANDASLKYLELQAKFMSDAPKARHAFSQIGDESLGHAKDLAHWASKQRF